jgi:hypothetical protein
MPATWTAMVMVSAANDLLAMTDEHPSGEDRPSMVGA